LPGGALLIFPLLYVRLIGSYRLWELIRNIPLPFPSDSRVIHVWLLVIPPFTVDVEDLIYEIRDKI
jgi:hypothetical protein